MRVSGLLFLLSIVGVAAALAVPSLRDLILVAGPMAVAALWLLWRSPHGGRGVARRDEETAPQARNRGVIRAKGRATASDAPPIVVDGSNLLHWKDGQPSLEPVRAAVAELTRRGFRPGVIFDANIGYKIGDRYLDDAPLAKLLGLRVDQVLVVPKGVPADQYILKSAQDLGARVVSNDRYRDWAEAHPEVALPGQLVRGGWADGKLWLGPSD